MKQNAWIFYISLACVLAVLLFHDWQAQVPTGPTIAKAQTTDEVCSKDRSIQVSGAAVINVTPDRALIQLGVQTNGSSPDKTHEMNQRDTTRVINAVKALGIEAKDIATDYLIVFPVYEEYSSLEIKGYRVDNTVSITLRDIGMVDDVLLAAFRAGANEVQDVQFYTSELRKYRDQARNLAMQAANEKAGALASSAGAEMGCVLHINENSWAHYYGSWRGGRETAMWAQNVIQNSSSAQDEPDEMSDSPISLGQIAVRAEVNASYSIK